MKAEAGTTRRPSRALPRDHCAQCGSCCRSLIVEADAYDIIREPRIFDADCGGHRPTFEAITTGDKVILLACGSQFPCAFLQADNCCAIYSTRPNACVGMQASGEQCREAREDCGLAPVPIEGVTLTVEDRRAYLAEAGRSACLHFEYLDVDRIRIGICLEPQGHLGPHKLVPDDQVGVKFKG